MPIWLRWVCGILIAAMVLCAPIYEFRASYAHAKRLRVVTDGKVIRCGQLTVNGFHEAHERYAFKSIVNLQEENEFQDPLIPQGYLGKPRFHESDVARELGCKWFLLKLDLFPRNAQRDHVPAVLDEFYRIFDDPSNYPILLHCKAGLHRTGLLTAVYRMEYEGWSKEAAVRELRTNGFGDGAATTGNDYVQVYLELYQPRRVRRLNAAALLAPAPAASLKQEATP
jgi:hypothetical protein